MGEVMYSIQKGDHIYTPLHSQIFGIEYLVQDATRYNRLDIDELFNKIKLDRIQPDIDYVSLEEVRNNIGGIISFLIRVGTVNTILEQYMFICKEGINEL